MWFITTVCEMVSDILGHQKFYLSKVDIFENLNKGILDVLIWTSNLSISTMFNVISCYSGSNAGEWMLIIRYMYLPFRILGRS